jgi:hypothetical protein
MGSHIEPVPADPAKCSPLLEFDDSSLEKAFWRDDKTLRCAQLTQNPSRQDIQTRVVACLGNSRQWQGYSR